MNEVHSKLTYSKTKSQIFHIPKRNQDYPIIDDWMMTPNNNKNGKKKYLSYEKCHVGRNDNVEFRKKNVKLYTELVILASCMVPYVSVLQETIFS